MSKIQTKTLKYIDLADVCEKNSPLDFWLDGCLQRQHVNTFVSRKEVIEILDGQLEFEQVYGYYGDDIQGMIKLLKELDEDTFVKVE